MGRKISTDSYRVAQLQDWEDEFWFLYREWDIKRSPTEIWMRAVEDSSRVGRYIRENKLLDAFRASAHVFCWIASFVNRLRHNGGETEDESLSSHFGSEFPSLGEILWEKFPHICSTCLNPICQCPIQAEKYDVSTVVKALEKHKKETFCRPRTITDWDRMFSQIYGRAHKHFTLEEIGFHWLEEIGETAKALRELLECKEVGDILAKRRDVIWEIADTVSWNFSLVSKVASLAESLVDVEKEYFSEDYNVDGIEKFSKDLTLGVVLWKEYAVDGVIVCPTCKQRPCRCGSRKNEEHTQSDSNS